MAAFGGFQAGMMSYLFLVLFAASSIIKTEALMYSRTRKPTCQLIKEPQCRENYNHTTMPNILGHENHDEASTRFHEFMPLIRSECSSHLKFFLCSLHFPMCTPLVPVGITACRAMCEEVRSKCEPYMEKFDFKWPESIDCSKLREHTEPRRRCLYPDQGIEREDDPNENPDDDVTDDAIPDGARPDVGRDRRKHGGRRRKKPGKGRDTNVDEAGATGKRKPNKDQDNQKDPPDGAGVPVEGGGVLPDVPVLEQEGGTQPGEEKWAPVDTIYSQSDEGADYADRDFDYPDNSDYDADIPGQFFPREPHEIPEPKCENPDKFVCLGRTKKMLPICSPDTDVLFSSTDKHFAYYWMLACAVLCIVSSALTVGTFLVDSKRFRYPERPIIFLSLCYMLYSSAYLVRLGRGPTGSVSCVTSDDSDVPHIVTGDLESTGCTAVFFLLYYFGMAAAVWWVILSVTWFLAAGLKWGHEAIEAHGFYFHLVAWLLPAVQTIVVLVMGKVDGDELTGLCYVGNLDPESLLYFVIVPLASYLSIGALALGCGFGSLFKIRRVILRKSGEKDAGKLEKLMLKIGIFTVLYIVPTACVVAVHVYQYRYHDAWMAKAKAWTCNPPGFTKYPANFARVNRQAPEKPFDADYTFPGYIYGDGTYWGGATYPDFFFRYQRPQYGQFAPPKAGPYASSSGLYGGQYQLKPANGYDYKPGTFSDDSEDDPQGKPDHNSHDGYGPFYTGNQLVRVPQNMNPIYGDIRGYRRPRARMRPMPYYPDMAERFGVTLGDLDRFISPVTDPTKVTAKERDCHLAESIPSFPIFVIKILMSLLAGITSGIWVWSGKTYKSWRIFCASSCCGRGDKEKGTIVTSNSPHATSTGNVNGAPSVTSQLLPKSANRQSRDYSRMQHADNRLSYPILSSIDRYDGCRSLTQDNTHVDTAYYSSLEHPHTHGSLTLGDLAREYCQNHELEAYDEESQRFLSPTDDYRYAANNTYIVTSQTKNYDVDNRRIKPANHSAGDKPKRNKGKKKKKEQSDKQSRDHTHSDPRFTRAIPNPYEDAPSHGPRPNPRHVIGGVQNHNNNNNNFKNTEHQKNGVRRARKHSEGDVNKLTHVSAGGLSPVSTATRKKAESVNIGTITSV